MPIRRLPAALSLIGAAAAADAAGVSSTWTAASDYDLRGITQSAHEPALQVSLDYEHKSGWYARAWISNVDFCASGAVGCIDANYEVDLIAGLRRSDIASKGLGWDVGLIYYTYQASDYNYAEIYAGLSKDWFQGKLSYSNDFGGETTRGATPAFYIEVNATAPASRNFSFLGHVGYSFGDYWNAREQAGTGRPYIDYFVGVAYTIRRFSLALKWVDGSDLKEARETPQDVLSSEARLVFTISTIFPWKGK